MKQCYYCEKLIDPEDLEHHCIAKLVDEDGNWVTDENGDELLAALCLECGRELGASTAAELKARGEAAEKSGTADTEGPIQ